MKVKRMNASSKKTNKAIREAFAELLKEKGDLSLYAEKCQKLALNS